MQVNDAAPQQGNEFCRVDLLHVRSLAVTATWWESSSRIEPKQAFGKSRLQI